MEDARDIKWKGKARKAIEGAGVLLHRAIGFEDPRLFDPFLLLDDFGSEDAEDFIRGFPWHPHRGIETVTYVLEGRVEHEDSLGNKGAIESGDVQWMTAGSGIFHQEMPLPGESGGLRGFQLWVNLPRKDKMMGPRYRGISRGEIPEIAVKGGARARIIAGSLEGQAGPVRDVVASPEYFDLSLPPKTGYAHPTRLGDTVFLYAYEGSGYIDLPGPESRDKGRSAAIEEKSIVLFGDGNFLRLRTEGSGLRCLIASGKALKEPIAWRGPIVMNEASELDEAYRELEAGSFVKAAP